MEIKEIKENKDMLNWMEVKFKDILDKTFIVNIKRVNILDDFKDELSRKLRGYYRRKERAELAKSYPTREELKNQIKNLVGEEILPKIK